MSSSFRRAGKTSATKKSTPSLLGARGVKAWTGGIHLSSVGLSDLDNILGGGQPLGTCILLEEDRWTRDLALSLVKYWCAEAISQKQRLIIPTAKATDDLDILPAVEDFTLLEVAEQSELEDLLFSLPRNLHWDKQKQREQSIQSSDNQTSTALQILQEGDEDEEEEKAEAGLEIAWQYRKSVQKERLAQPTEKARNDSSTTLNHVFCHSYDLSGRMHEQTQMDTSKYLVTMQSMMRAGSAQSAGLCLFRDMVAVLNGKESKCIRLLLFHPNLEALSVALPLLLAHIRSHSIPAVVMVCTPPTSNHKVWTGLARSCDVVLSTEGFSSRKEYPPPPEFRHLQGLLTITKIATVTAATANGGGHYGDMTISKRPAAFIYGFKRDRRKLHIPLLHIPPEDYAAGGDSVGSGVRSGGGKGVESKKKSSGMGCSSNLSGSVLDF